MNASSRCFFSALASARSISHERQAWFGYLRGHYVLYGLEVDAPLDEHGGKEMA
jgi:hypothetical protein